MSYFHVELLRVASIKWNERRAKIQSLYIKVSNIGYIFNFIKPDNQEEGSSMSTSIVIFNTRALRK